MKRKISPIEYVGVLSQIDLLFSSLKREALFFDVIAIPKISDFISKKSTSNKFFLQSLEFLFDKGVIIDPVKEYLGDEEYQKKIGKYIYDEVIQEISSKAKIYRDNFDYLNNIKVKQKIKNLEEYFTIPIAIFLQKLYLGFSLGLIIPFEKISAKISHWTRIADYNRRGIAYDLRQNYGINAFPIYRSNALFNDEYIKGKETIIHLIIEQLPEPDYETISWEQILEFRADQDSKNKMFALRNWVNDIIKGKLTGFEIYEKFEFLKNEYTQHMKLQKIKMKSCVWETILKISASILEGIVTFKPKDAIKSIIKIKNSKVDLYEKELLIPGHELAYIIKASKEFK